MKDSILTMKERGSKIKKYLYAILLMISAFVIPHYMNSNYEYVLRIVLIALFLLSCIWMPYRIGIAKNAALAVVSAAFSAVILFGYHIHYEELHGTAAQNYIVPYSLKDAAAFAFIALGIFQLSRAGMCLSGQKDASNRAEKIDMERLPAREIWITAILLFLLWIPYLLTYWPGLICNDAMSSVAQILGLAPWSNHHPVVYTLFIRFCFAVGHRLTGSAENTAGCAVYSVLQMAFMAFCFSYMFVWLRKRFRLSFFWLIGLTAVYGLTPYIATYSIAMWKDPIFSCAVVLVTLLLADFCFSHGKAAVGRKWRICFAASCLIMIFFRNNGIYILALLLVFFLLLFFRNARRKKREKRYALRVGILCAVMIVFYEGITGPVYRACGVQPGEPAEQYGVFLNQLARTVVCDGNLSAADREYLNKILPLDQYADAYSPMDIDDLKWHAGFNNEPLNDHFIRHWFSVFRKNPRLCLEAVALETYGFWTVNRPEVVGSADNISGAFPGNLYPDHNNPANGLIECSNLTGSETARRIFRTEETSFPVGWVTWIIVFLIVRLMFSGRKHWLPALLPSAGLLITLVLASPLNYWARYGAALQFMLPVYIVFFPAAVHGPQKAE